MVKQNRIYIYGKHAVSEALESAPHTLRKFFISREMDDRELRKRMLASGIPVETLDPRRISSYAEGNAAHQGIVALVSPSMLNVPFETFVEKTAVSSSTLLVMMDGVHDPHNVGAIIRSAVAFGASGILMPESGQAHLTSAVVRASAGMAFRIPLVVCTDGAGAIRALKEKGVRAYALSGEAEHAIGDEPFRAPTLLVVGNEAFGVSKKVRTACDLTLSIPMNPRAESLNVAASAAVAMYAWSLKHKKVLEHTIG